MSDSSTELVVFDSKLIEDQEYWIKKVSSHTWTHSIARDYEGPSVAATRRLRMPVIIDGSAYQGLQKIAGPSDFLTYTLLLASLKLCLARYSSESVIVVGSPPLKQARPNVLAIVDSIEPEMPVQQWLMNVRVTLLDAYARQDYPFSYLIRTLGSGAQDCLLFNVTMAFGPLHGEMPPLNADLHIFFDKEEDKLRGYFEFEAGALDHNTVERLAKHLAKTIGEVVKNINATVADIDILTDEEKRRALNEWNNTSVSLSANFCVHEAFTQQAKRTPNAIAVEFQNKQMSYASLDERSNQLTAYLKRRGAGQDVTIGFFIDRSPEMIVSILGILKAGAAYLPLDLTHPKERLAFMLSDVASPIVITTKTLAASLPKLDLEIIYLDADWDEISRENTDRCVTASEPESLAYVIYTSGSTGTPKGVMVSHAGLANYVMWAVQTYATQHGYDSIIHTPIGFDLTVTSLFPALLQGGKVMLLPEESSVEDLATMLSRVKSFGVLKLTPAHMAILDQYLEAEQIAEWQGSLVVGGEALLTQHIRNVLMRAPLARIFNEYGPTEATVGCCVHELARDSEAKGMVPIGRPIANAQMFLLDQQLRLVPVGVRGEIYIGGEGLARGYNNRPDLTAERFIPNPFSSNRGGRIYRSGDWGRYRADGTIEYLGRADCQVKIRGYRVELGEIEAALLQYPDILDAAVIVREAANGERSLVAFICSSQPAVSESDLKAHLANCLPDYMLPSKLVIMPELPLGMNGKVDRRALAQMDPFAARQRRPMAGPRNHIEEVLIEIWRELLEKQEISIYDSFFELGGHSLFATQVVSRIGKRLHLELPLHHMFEFPTIAGLADVIAKMLNEGAAENTGSFEITKRDQASEQDILQSLDQFSATEVEVLLESLLGQE